MNKYVIGIGGIARAGKDTACQMLLERFSKMGISARRIALADNLKLEIRGKLIEDHGIDILNCAPEQKEQMRPALVAFGKARREKSSGTFWTGLVEQEMLSVPEDVIVVPDIRYDIFEKDERYWVQDKMNGLLVHVARYSIQRIPSNIDGEMSDCKIWVTPPNADEADNDPRIREAADFNIEWETSTPEELEKNHGVILNEIANCAKNELQRLRR